VTPPAPHEGDVVPSHAPDGSRRRRDSAVSLRTLPVAAWVLYDFANSIYPAVITTAVFSVYFARVVVGNADGLGDLWWLRVVSLSMLIVAVTSPVMGAIADQGGLKKVLLGIYTAVCVVSVALFTTIEPGDLAWAFTLAVLANIGFEGALVFYNAYLPELAPPSHHGRLSGIGFGVGYLGSIAGLLLVLPLVTPDPHEAIRYDAVWWTVAIFFAVGALPCLIWLPAPARRGLSVWQAAAAGIREFRRIARDVAEHVALRRFLLAYFLYIDGVTTAIYFTGIYASTTLGFTNGELIYLFVVVQVSALVGAFLLASPTDRWGPKPVVSLTLVAWTAITVAVYFVHAKATFFGVIVFAGTGLGAIQSASRAFVSRLIPVGKEGEVFGFYALCGKSSAILGPLILGSLSHALGGNQRVALLSLAAFFLAGLLLLQRVETPG
jgi:UMF1 family MFS transporter